MTYDINEIKEMMQKDGVNPYNWLEFCTWLGRNGIEMEID